MTARRDPDRKIHAFLEEGQTQLADQVLDSVRVTIEQTHQRAVVGPWRMPIMHRFVPLGLGVAAVVAVLLVGAQLLGPRASNPVAAPSTPTATPTEVPPTSSPEGLLPEGSLVLVDEAGVQISVTIAAPDWYGETAGGTLVKQNNPNAPDGAGLITFAGIPGYLVYGDPCQWSTTTPATTVTTVDALVAALATQATRDASAPVDVDVDGHAGKSITLHVPADANFGECDRGKFGSWGVAEFPEPLRYQQSPGQIDKLWILDVDGGLVILDAGYFEGTPQAVLDELDAIVRSVTFK